MTTTTRQFKGRHLAIIMICFFGVIFTVNITMAVLANRNWTGLVVKNSYVASQKFNRYLDAAKVQKAHGWTSDIHYEDSILRINLWSKDRHPLDGSEVKATIGRPAFEQYDHVILLVAVAKGIYQAENALAPGLWSIQFDAIINGSPYRRDARIYVGHDGRGVLQ